jgi:DNA invertase Pin-like site-specific DNA recombinase
MRPVFDAHGMAVRTPNPGLTPDGTKKIHPLTGIQKKNYDKQAILDLLLENILTQKQIADKHKISRVTVMAISKEAGIVKRSARHGQSLINTKLEQHHE